MIEGLILLIVGIGALGAFVVGMALLVMWYRAGQANNHNHEPVIYGDMIQCPNCGWMNPLDTAVCLKCHTPLHVPSDYRPTIPPTNLPAQGLAPYVPPVSGTPAGLPPGGATMRSPYAPPAPQPGMADGTIRANAMPSPQSPPTPAQTAVAQRPDAASSSPAAAVPSEAWLEVTAGTLKGQRLALSQSDTLFGRSTKCDVQIPDQKVSRKHFVVRYAQGAYFLQDQGSTSGTLINGEPVEARRLANGDRIDLGDTTLVFHMR